MNLLGVADTDTMKMLATSTVHSVASYGCAIYAADKKQSNRVQIKLNKTMRLATGSKLSRHVRDMIDEMKWLKFTQHVDYMKVMLLHNIVATSAAPYCKMLISAASHQTRYSVRERDLRIAWRPKMARRGCKSYLYTSVILYNQIKLLGKKMKTSQISKFTKSTLLAWR